MAVLKVSIVVRTTDTNGKRRWVPATGNFTPQVVWKPNARSATLLSNSKVLVAGGGSRFPLASAELYQ